MAPAPMHYFIKYEAPTRRAAPRYGAPMGLRQAIFCRSVDLLRRIRRNVHAYCAIRLLTSATMAHGRNVSERGDTPAIFAHRHISQPYPGDARKYEGSRKIFIFHS